MDTYWYKFSNVWFLDSSIFYMRKCYPKLFHSVLIKCCSILHFIFGSSGFIICKPYLMCRCTDFSYYLVLMTVIKLFSAMRWSGHRIHICDGKLRLLSEFRRINWLTKCIVNRWTESHQTVSINVESCNSQSWPHFSLNFT